MSAGHGPRLGAGVGSADGTLSEALMIGHEPHRFDLSLSQRQPSFQSRCPWGAALLLVNPLPLLTLRSAPPGLCVPLAPGRVEQRLTVVCDDDPQEYLVVREVMGEERVAEAHGRMWDPWRIRTFRRGEDFPPPA